VNDNGGIGGRQVELVILDNAYDVPKHLENYEVFSGEGEEAVVMFSQSTGSPHTAAIAEQAGRGQPDRHPVDVVLRLGRPRGRQERLRGTDAVLHRVDERRVVPCGADRGEQDRDRVLPR
jgi:hypothetical protein